MMTTTTKEEDEYRNIKISIREIALIGFLIHLTKMDQSYLETKGMKKDTLVMKWLDDLDQIHQRLLSDYHGVLECFNVVTCSFCGKDLKAGYHCSDNFIIPVFACDECIENYKIWRKQK